MEKLTCSIERRTFFLYRKACMLNTKRESLTVGGKKLLTNPVGMADMVDLLEYEGFVWFN